MLATLYLLAATIAGFAVITRLAPSVPTIVRLPGGFLLGIVATSWTSYVVADLFRSPSGNSLHAGVIVSTVLSLAVAGYFGRHLRLRHLRIGALDAAVSIASLGFSAWLIGERLQYDPTGDHPLLVSANTWGDFGLHIALSRSFAVGSNYPTEYPFFAGEPIRYHFGFDFFAGSLQNAGFSVLHSFNIPGTIGLASMMLMLFAIARLLFGVVRTDGASIRWWRDRGVWAGFVAILVLITNQSLEWLRYIKRDGHGSVWTALDPSRLWHHTDYLSIGPYSNDRIAIFNTMNPYLTQTHLIVAMAFVLFLVYMLLDQLRSGTRMNKPVLGVLGVAFGLSFWLNGVLWIASTVFFGALLLIYAASGVFRRRQQVVAARRAPGSEPERDAADDQPVPSAELATTRGELLAWLKVGACFLAPALLIGVPQAIWLNGGSTDGGSLSVHLGYLVCSSPHAACNARGQMDLLSLTDWGSFLTYWWLNEGLVLPLVILAFIVGANRDRKIILAITAIFVWGSVFQLGRDLGGQNHKTFNLWDNLNGLYVGFMLVQLWVGASRLRTKFSLPKITTGVLRVVVVFAAMFLSVSGLIDYMTVKNDFKTTVFGDATEQQAISWIQGNTPKKAVFLMDFDQLYSAPTLAGRDVYLGYSPWASGAGYDVDPRKAVIKQIFEASSGFDACGLLTKHKIDYVMISRDERTTTNFTLNQPLFEKLLPAKSFGTGDDAYAFYSVKDAC